MSFGFGVGDFLAVIEIATKIRAAYIEAPEHIRTLSDEVQGLTNLLQDFVSEDAYPPSEQATNLKLAVDSSREVLGAMEKLVDSERLLFSVLLFSNLWTHTEVMLTSVDARPR